MIKAIRRIIQDFCVENKIRKYLFYALGEIFLVVIGILLAISLNNYNQDRISELDLENKLKKIREEIYNDSIRFEYIQDFNRQRIELVDKSLKIIEGDLAGDDYHQFIELLTEVANSTKTFAPNSQTYTSLINSGQFSRITDDSLKDRISFLYFYYDHIASFNYTAINNVQLFYQELFSKGILSAKYLDVDVEGINEEARLFLKEILQNPGKKIIFENYLYEEKKLSHSIIRRNQLIFDRMSGLPLKPLVD